MWLGLRTTKLLSILLDMREVCASLSVEEQCPEILATYVSATIQHLGYPLAEPPMIHCCRAGRFDVDVQKLTYQGTRNEQLTDEVFTVLSAALREASYNGEELMVSMHSSTCALISFKPPIGALTRW